jgi:hypothetical protein
VPKKTVEDYSFTIEKIKENADGSVDCVVHLSDFVKGKLIEKGVIAMLQEYINQEEKKKNVPKRRNNKTSRDNPDVS